jgi:hypothetical protein
MILILKGAKHVFPNSQTKKTQDEQSSKKYGQRNKSDAT